LSIELADFQPDTDFGHRRFEPVAGRSLKL
jgi:hypothetical protein